MKPLSEYELVIFDCDHTLAVTGNVILESLHRTVQDYLEEFPSLRHCSLESLHDMENGRGLNYRLGEIQRICGFQFPDLAQVKGVFSKHVEASAPDHVRAVEGAGTFLQMLVESGKKLAVGSNSDRPDVLSFLRAAEVLHHFDHAEDRPAIFSPAQTGAPKPDAGFYPYIAEQFGIAAEKTIIVEDSVPGAQAALNAGMRVICITAAAPDPEGRKAVLKDIGVPEEDIFASYEAMREAFKGQRHEGRSAQPVHDENSNPFDHDGIDLGRIYL